MAGTFLPRCQAPRQGASIFLVILKTGAKGLIWSGALVRTVPGVHTIPVLIQICYVIFWRLSPKTGAGGQSRGNFFAEGSLGAKAGSARPDCARPRQR